MKKVLKFTAWLSAISLVILLTIALFLSTTTSGLYCVIRLANLYYNHPVKVVGLNGSLRTHFSIDKLYLSYQNTQITIEGLKLNWQLSDFLIHHRLMLSRLTADSLEVKKNNSNYKFNNLLLQGGIEQNTLTLSALELEYMQQKLSGILSLDMNAPYPISSTININPDQQNTAPWHGHANLSGTRDLLQWNGRIDGSGAFSFKGSLTQNKQLQQIIQWRNATWPITSTQSLESTEGIIHLQGTLPDLAIIIDTKVQEAQKDPWLLKGQISGSAPWNWTIDLNLSQPTNNPKELVTTLNLLGSIKDYNQGQLSLKILPGHYPLPINASTQVLDFQGGIIKSQLSPKGLNGSGQLVIDKSKKLAFSFHLPKFNLAQGLGPNQPLNSELSLAVSSLDFLQELTPAIKNPKGSLTATLKTTGTLKTRTTQSQLAIQNASIDLPQFGLNLNAINLEFVSKNQLWEGKGSIGLGNKALSVQTQGQLRPPFNSNTKIQGEDIPILNTNQYKINISPDLVFAFQNQILSITGTVLVPSAQITLAHFTNSLSLSNDVVFEQQQTKQVNVPLHTQMNVTLTTGNPIELTAKGLHATLEGGVVLTQNPQGPLNATGELNVVQGEYKAYGQDLAIEQGELFFTGGNLENPGINVRASKKIDTSTTSTTFNPNFDLNNNDLPNSAITGDIQVGVEVSGRLLDPEIQLFSNPAILSQADILSMLVLGRPANQANKAGGQLLLAAISSMNLSGQAKGTQLLEQLKQNLGLDFNVQSNSNYNLLTNTVTDQTAFVVSKSLSKRISLSYNVGLSQADPNVVTLKYLLNKFFSIQVSSSTTSSGVDVLYTSSKKKPGLKKKSQARR
jgi:translocation and assembly module TamB